MPFQSNIESREAQIKDALEHNLAVVVCMWGSYSWSKKDVTLIALFRSLAAQFNLVEDDL